MTPIPNTVKWRVRCSKRILFITNWQRSVIYRCRKLLYEMLPNSISVAHLKLYFGSCYWRFRNIVRHACSQEYILNLHKIKSEMYTLTLSLSTLLFLFLLQQSDEHYSFLLCLSISWPIVLVFFDVVILSVVLTWHMCAVLRVSPYFRIVFFQKKRQRRKNTSRWLTIFSNWVKYLQKIPSSIYSTQNISETVF